jgi:hypothetical protein
MSVERVEASFQFYPSGIFGSGISSITSTPFDLRSTYDVLFSPKSSQRM